MSQLSALLQKELSSATSSIMPWSTGLLTPRIPSILSLTKRLKNTNDKQKCRKKAFLVILFDLFFQLKIQGSSLFIYLQKSQSLATQLELPPCSSLWWLNRWCYPPVENRFALNEKRPNHRLRLVPTPVMKTVSVCLDIELLFLLGHFWWRKNFFPNLLVRC